MVVDPAGVTEVMLVEPDEHWNRILSLLVSAMGLEVVVDAPLVLFGAGAGALRAFREENPASHIVAVVNGPDDGQLARDAGASAVVLRSHRRLLRDLQHALH